MASGQLSIVVDDKRSETIVLTGPASWTTTSLQQWFNGTVQSPDFALNNSGQFGTLQMKFHGTSVAFFGVTPPVFPGSQNLTVSIDGGTPYNTSYADPNPQSYRQWYQSPLLSDGDHNIELSHIAGTSLDFAVITVGQDTPLAGQKAIVDNDDSAITFNGNWRRSQDMFNSGPQPDGFPYHNTTHQTTEAGSSFTYHFTGSSAAIYGIFTWSNLGLISLTFTLDGQSLSQSYRVKTDTPQFVSELGQQQNFLFYSYDFLQSGNHTLVVNVTDCVNQTFAFDFLTYTPSFSTLASMPNLTQGSTGASSASQSEKSSTAIIVGGVGGAVLLIAFLSLIFIFRKRRRSKGMKYKPVYPFVHPPPDVTVIPLSYQRNLPSTASTNSDAAQPHSSPAHHSFSPVDLYHPEGSRPLPLPTADNSNEPSNFDRPFDDLRESYGTGNADTSSVYRGRGDGARQWEGSSGELSPPSYDETTGGRGPPTHISYIIQR
ncbi:hypothetical protein M413DRAFT_445030 [Hebeloma cylindrosporum]|uniref:Transmembrane protein n=1 Tax=Hebeloma cylindrosporum TaxID=76867 RepID=A0A0C3CDX8_HEBCY|nr:hypothetical protein M413DRAFT_445030 [Hebeloma cylindrosporum h7]